MKHCLAVIFALALFTVACTTLPASTQTPAVFPTASPVALPTALPTHSPTLVATASPTALPTVSPTATVTATRPPTTQSATIATATRPPVTATRPPASPTAAATPALPSPTAARPTPQVRSVVPAEIERGNSTRRQVALTFDAGSSAALLPQILAALRQAGIHSTFFLTGAWAKDNPDGVKAIVAGGHEIANHSYSHPDFTTISDAQIIEELQTTEEIIQKIVGRTTKPYFRPPFGARDKRVLAAAWSAGYRSVYWTIDSGDWREDATVDGVIAKILNNASNGAIFIEHVGSPQTAEGLPRIIAGLRDKGYEIVPLSVVVQ